MATTTKPEGALSLTMISMMVLIGVEVFAVAIAGGWALAGLFELGDVIGWVLMGLFSLFGVYLMVQLWHRAQAQRGTH